MKKSIITILIVFFYLMSIGQNEKSNGIEFIYTYKQDNIDTTIFHVDAKIINKTKASIWFLTESCNKLDYFLKTDSSDFFVYVLSNCNASFPLKNVIHPKCEFAFKTTLKMRKQRKKINLELNLIILNKKTAISGKSVYEFRNDTTLKTIILRS